MYDKEESWERCGDREPRHRQRKRKVGDRVSINKKFTSFVYNVHVHVHAYTCRLFVKLSSTYLRSPRSAQSTGRLLTLQRSQSGSTSTLLTSSIRHNLQQPATKAQPCSVAIDVHFSFDMAQQVFYPNDPLQPGPMYFLTPRKCAIYGVCCEAIPHQVNYLIDEAVDIGKRANSIISMVHHFFVVHGLGKGERPPPHGQPWGSK